MSSPQLRKLPTDDRCESVFFLEEKKIIGGKMDVEGIKEVRGRKRRHFAFETARSSYSLLMCCSQKFFFLFSGGVVVVCYTTSRFTCSNRSYLVGSELRRPRSRSVVRPSRNKRFFSSSSSFRLWFHFRVSPIELKCCYWQQQQQQTAVEQQQQHPSLTDARGNTMGEKKVSN